MSSSSDLAASAAVPTVTPALIQELLEKHGEALLQGLAKMLQGSAPASAPSGGKAPKSAKAKAPKAKAASEDSADAEPKEKRAPNAWILFSARVEKLVRAAEEAAETPKESRMKTVVAKQFASHLKGLKAYDEWADDEVTEALSGWTPPETSKQAVAKAEKEASVAGSESGSVAGDDAEAAPAAPAEKTKRKWSDEAKAAAAAKRAAKKAAAPADAPDAASAPAPAEAAPAPVKKAITLKPKAAPAPVKKVDLSFFTWTHEGKEYYTNDRGDVATTDFEWVGRFNGQTIDETVPEPADLSEATLRE
jgi:hypothetical protein